MAEGNGIKHVTDQDFEKVVLQGGKPAFVDFWAPWCGPCRAVAPVLEQLAEETEKVEFVRLDIDENPEVASKYDVLSIPTVMVFDRGAAKQTIVGARSRRHYAKALASYL